MSFNEFFEIYASVSDDVRIEISDIVNILAKPSCDQELIAEYPDKLRLLLQQTPFGRQK